MHVFIDNSDTCQNCGATKFVAIFSPETTPCVAGDPSLRFVLRFALTPDHHFSADRADWFSHNRMFVTAHPLRWIVGAVDVAPSPWEIDSGEGQLVQMKAAMLQRWHSASTKRRRKQKLQDVVAYLDCSPEHAFVDRLAKAAKEVKLAERSVDPAAFNTVDRIDWGTDIREILLRLEDFTRVRIALTDAGPQDVNAAAIAATLVDAQVGVEARVSTIEKYLVDLWGAHTAWVNGTRVYASPAELDPLVGDLARDLAARAAGDIYLSNCSTTSPKDVHDED